MSAKQRRVHGPVASNPTQPQQPQQPSQLSQAYGNDMTLPMVLQLFEKRIRKMEEQSPKVSPETESLTKQIQEVVLDWNSFQSEYDSRFNILATEINQLKDLVLKLQSYTMGVNKTLLEERVHFLSAEKENIVFSSTAE
jgi:hypothetical protein